MVISEWKRIHDLEDQARRRLPDIKAWAATLKGASDFELNLQIVAEAEYLGRRQFGIAAYLPEAFRRAQVKLQAEEKRADRIEPTGPVETAAGVTLEGEVVKLVWQESPYGDTPKVTVLLDDGNLLWGTLPAAGRVPEVVGSRVRFVANVTRSDRDQHFGFFKHPRRWETTELSEKGRQHAAHLAERQRRSHESGSHAFCPKTCPELIAKRERAGTPL